MSNTPLGLNISLPPGTLSTIQENRASQQQQQQDQLANSEGHSHASDNEDNEDDLINRQNNPDEIDEDDRVIMHFIPSDSDDQGSTTRNGNENNNGSVNDNNDDNDGENDNNDENSEDSDGLSLDDVSLSPPSSMPLLAVEFDKLCGYTPSDEQEAKRLADELCEALLGVKVDNSEINKVDADDNGDDDDDDDDDGNSNEKDSKTKPISDANNISETKIIADSYACAYGDGLSVEFTSRAVELLEAGIARHTDTLQQQEMMMEDGEDGKNSKLKFAFVPYPEYLSLPSPPPPPGSSTVATTSNSEDGNERPSIMATTKIWKRITHPHDIPIVHTLLKLLSKCSRSLMWKHDMTMEIRRIAKEEKRWKEESKRRKELKIWRTKTRPDELAKLYDVRETFELKLETLQTKYDGYVKDREERVQRDLQSRKEKGIGGGGIAGLDWDCNVTFAFDDDVEEIVQKVLLEEQGIKGDHSSIDDGYHDSAEEDFDGHHHDNGYDCDDGGSGNEESNDDDNDNDKYNAISHQQMLDQSPTGTDLPLERKKRRAKAASKRMRRKLEAEKEKARAVDLRLKIKAAHDEEEYVRQMCISTDEKLAMVMVNNVKERLEKVDDLLDSLQTDAWNDEEEGLLNSDSSDDEQETEDNDGDMTLLDSILAMILGAIPPSQQSSTEEHFTTLKQEHETIVEGWKDTFGRIPKLTNEKTKKRPIKEASPNRNSDLIVSNSIWDIDDDDAPITNQRRPFKMDLVDSIPDNWENEADCDDFFSPGMIAVENEPTTEGISSLGNVSPPNNARLDTKKISLRPGGR